MDSQISSPRFNGAPAEPRPHEATRRASRTPRGWRRCLIAGATAVLLGAVSAHAAAPLPMLLGSPAAPDAGPAAVAAPVAERSVARQRPVAVNFQYLDPASGAAPTQLGVELFDGQVVTLERSRVEQRGRNNYTWHGRVRGYEGSDALLTVVDGQIAGTIVLADTGIRAVDTYQVQSAPGGGQSLRRLDPSGFPPDHPPGHEATHVHATAPAGAADAVGTAADTGDTIDVMIVYSNQTAAAAGATIGTQIQAAVDRANLAYANSGIATRLRLVHYQQVAYNESTSFDTDLNRLTTAGDGYLDEVPALRTAHGADLVSMFVENGQYCGIGWLGPNASYGFTVVNRGCAGGNLSFAHEVGHNIGARHDPYVDPNTTPYPYGHGYAYPAARWRTVMAYDNACAAAGTSCTRIAYISNPNVLYGGTPTGTAPTSDNARLHNENAYTVANFRAAVGGACTYTLTPASAAASAAAGSSSFTVTAGAGCDWTAQSNAPSWLTIDIGSGTSASGTLLYSVTANAGPARSGGIAIGDRTFTVNQATGCTYALSPTSASVAASGGPGIVGLTAGAACPWTASSSATWLTVSSTAGSGSAAVNYAVAANTGTSRSANLTVGGVTFVVTQDAAPPVAKLSATSISFAQQRVGSTSSAKSVTLKNGGGGTLTVLTLTAGGANPGDFVASGTCAPNTALTAGQSCTLQYRFKPAAKGSRSASLAIATDAGTVVLGLSGTGK